MTDIFGDQPFQPTPIPGVPATEEPKTTKRRGARRTAPATAPVPAPKKRGRKPKADKHAPDVAVPKMDLATALSIGASLKTEDAPLFTKIVAALQQLKKGQRDRIVGAIGKVFA